MKDLLRNLLNALDLIGRTSPEIYDSVCREHMGDVVFNLFLKPTPEYTMSDDFGLWSAEGNLAVKLALERYIASARALAPEMGLSTFRERLEAFQYESVCSDLEGNYHDDFFGWMDPEAFDAEGSLKT